MPVSTIATFTADDPRLPAAHATFALIWRMSHCLAYRVAVVGSDALDGDAFTASATASVSTCVLGSRIWKLSSQPTSPRSDNVAAEASVKPLATATPTPSYTASTVPPRAATRPERLAETWLLLETTRYLP